MKSPKLKPQPLRQRLLQAKLYIDALRWAWRQDLTKGWAKIQAYGSAGVVAGLGGLKAVNDVISDDTFKSYLQALDVPKSVLIAIAIIGLISWITIGRNNDA